MHEMLHMFDLVGQLVIKKLNFETEILMWENFDISQCVSRVLNQKNWIKYFWFDQTEFNK